MKSESQGRSGGRKTSDGAITACAAETALATKGVAELAGTRTEIIANNLLMKDSSLSGVRLSRGDTGIVFDIFVAVDYGANIPAVSWNLQKNIKNKVESLSGENVTAINVHVQRVKFPLNKEEDFTDE